MSELVTQEEITEEDYRAIEEAVMETARGRWFLKEYSKRNRVSDTDTVLGAIEGLKSYISRSDEPADVLQMRLDIVDMTHTIDQLKAEINSFDPQSPDGHFKDAQDQLSVVVDETEQATSSILAAAENVQQIAWEMRDEGGFPQFCDQLDALATDIYTSCSFQDLTGQRLRKVVDVTAFLEDRLRTMIAVWDSSQETGHTTGSGYTTYDAGLENGPAMPGKGQGQSDIDFMLNSDEEVPNKDDHFELSWADDDDDEYLESDPLTAENGYDTPLVTTDLSLEPETPEGAEAASGPESALLSSNFDNIDLDLTEIPEISHDQEDLSQATGYDEASHPDQVLSVEPEQELYTLRDDTGAETTITPSETDVTDGSQLDTENSETFQGPLEQMEALEDGESVSPDVTLAEASEPEFVAESESIDVSTNEASVETDITVEDQLDADIEALDGLTASDDEAVIQPTQPSSEDEVGDVTEDSLPLIQRQVMFS